MPGQKVPYDDSYITPPDLFRIALVSDPDFQSITSSPITIPRSGSGTGLLAVFVQGCNPSAGECDMAIRCPAPAGIVLANPDAIWCTTAFVHDARPGAIFLEHGVPGDYQVRLV